MLWAALIVATAIAWAPSVQAELPTRAEAPQPARAEPPPPTRAEPPEWAYGMAHDVMSPFCPGVTLAECPSPQAYELRLWILMQSSAGASRDEIETVLYDRFGEQIRSAPRAEGWGLAAYAIPLLGFLVGGAVVILFLRKWVAPGRPPAESEMPRSAPSPVDPELERLIDEELQRG